MKIHAPVRLRIPALILFLALTARLEAGPLTEARVNKIINEVTVLDPAAGVHAASINEVIKNEIGLKTGIKSRSELLFQDNTLTRIGPESFFSFKPGTREMALKEGTMLLQVPKGIGGAKIRTAAVTASITGTTIMMEYHPKKSIKVLVLEGSLRLSVNGSFGDSLLLLPGKMVIMHPNDRRIPDPVSVDLAMIKKTSKLVQMSEVDGKVAKGEPLPSMALIDAEIDKQAQQKDGKQLVNTNLVILGGGTDVVMASDNVIETLKKKKEAEPFLLVSNGNGNGGGATPAPTVPPAPTATPAPTAIPAVTPSATPAPTATPTATPSATPAPSATPVGTPIPTATPSATPGATATPMPTPAGSPLVISGPGDVYISTPITAAAVDITAGRRLIVNASIDTGLLTFDAGSSSQINGTITADTLNGTVAGNLNINRTLDVDDITLDLTNYLYYSVALVAPVRSGGFFTAPFDGRKLTIYAQSFDFNYVGGNAPITLNGGDAFVFSLFEGGSGGTLNVGTSARPIAGPINVLAPIVATTGQNGFMVWHGGDGGTVSLVSNDKINVSSEIRVSDKTTGRASRKGGNIVLDSRKTSGTAVNIQSSAQLLSLLSGAAPGPGGSIKITSAGGQIAMAGTATADRGTVDIRNNGNTGNITVTGATLHGDVVKIGALGNNGTLVVNGGNISADSSIKLYAGGSNGSVKFTGNVTLSGTSVKTIYGQTVTISNGKIVTVLGPGPANVFTNNANYAGFGGNGSTSGTFAGQGATTRPLSAGPGY